MQYFAVYLWLAEGHVPNPLVFGSGHLFSDGVVVGLTTKCDTGLCVRVRVHELTAAVPGRHGVGLGRVHPEIRRFVLLVDTLSIVSTFVLGGDVRPDIPPVVYD